MHAMVVKENDDDGEVLMTWYFGYEGKKMKTRMSVWRVIKIEMTFFSNGE
jgi:hypothetical protein